ncbi:MAG: hypothetical protein RJA34_1378 [Pseudomonadota bacterium]|jgi:energy-coupling factor transporter ATP-binding protein EcfA2
MSGKSSPWTARFEGLLNREAIRSRAEIQPNFLQGLLDRPTHLAVSALELALSELMVLTEVELDILVRFVKQAHSYSVRAYPDLRTYIAQLHADEIDVLSPAPVCFTGLAGAGKSALLSALARALPDDAQLDLNLPITNGKILTRSSVLIRVNGNTNFAELLQPWLPSEVRNDKVNDERDSARSGIGRTGIPEVVRRAARFSYRSGLCASVVDEMQFMTQSSVANAKVTQFLLLASYLKVPLIYCANYSLCHKLLKRNNEDQDRLLAKPLVLLPLGLDDDGLGRLLRAYDVVMRDVLDGSLCQFMGDFATMTLGIKRKVWKLTIESYRFMREKGHTKLRIEHIRGAFEKNLSESYHRDIRDLKRQSIEGKPVRGRSDIWCPFGDDFNRLEMASAKVQRDEEKRINHALMLDSLNLSERKNLDRLKAVLDGKPESSSPRRKKADVVELPTSRKGGLSAADLLKNTMSNRDH